MGHVAVDERARNRLCNDTQDTFTMEVIKGGITEVKVGLHGPPDIVVTADSETFCDMFWGDLNPTQKYLRGEIQVKASQEDNHGSGCRHHDHLTGSLRRPHMTPQRMQVGQYHQSTHRITREMIQRFAEATGDFNPIHLDEEFAKETLFGRPVAHGMLLAGILSGVLGTQFPGVGTIYVSQTLRFLRPVFIGDELTLTLRVVERIEERNRLRIETSFDNQDGERVLTGEAVVIPPSAS